LFNLGSLHPVNVLQNAQMFTKGIDDQIELCHEIHCNVSNRQSSGTWDIDVKATSVTNAIKDQSSELLLQTLSKIMVQRTIEDILNEDRKGILNIYIKTLESSSQHRLAIDEKSTETVKDVVNVLFSIEVDDEVELVEMVDSNGNPMGSLPRNIVHQLNILHRGIGILPVRYPSSAMPDNDDFDIYVHQRTSTKRIFPSLYDMFVGGVSAMNESSELTAIRELTEELGMSRNDALSEPLFRCIVCTSYNRCVVTCFRYIIDDQLDTIKWQKEEVQWGGFCSYKIIRDAAALSVNRLIDQNKWPGEDNKLWSVSNSGKNEEIEGLKESDKLLKNDGYEWNTWDFVPDGLLVWQAWEEIDLEMTKNR